ncbi:pickpocket protein 28 [Leptinotarsa decemlineata]|uniref:pickpocket protein 28 n=1 Tax=Leptinotarsa decemlineata TaxID=7539 RepID=UPI003D308E70
MLGYTAILLHHLAEDNFEYPVIVTPESAGLPIQKIEFPGVAICSINKISKKRALKLAKLLQKIEKDADFRTLVEDIKLLGNLYDLDIYDPGRLSEFQDLLDDIDNTTEIDDPKLRMRELTAPCEEMLSDCKWAGEKYNCSDLFASRMTYDGICCVFNYVKPLKETSEQERDSVPPPLEPQRPLGSGIEYGLTVELHNNIEDYFLSTFETTGYSVKIFNPQDFPDKISGSLSDIIVNFGIEVLLSIDVEVVKSSDFMKILPYNMRSCIFEDEEKTSFGSYRHSDCMVECKLRIMKDMCNCIPITSSTNYDMEGIGDVNFCTLIDLPCLNKYRTKWLKYFPIGVSSSNLENEKYDSMKCTKCYPSCNNIIYKVSSNTAPLFHHRYKNRHSYLNVFFNKPFVASYQMDVSETWYDMIANIGGFLSLFMGISVITAMEIIILVYKLTCYCISRINAVYFQ